MNIQPGCSATSPPAGSLMIIYDQMTVTMRMMMPVRWKIVIVSVMMIKELKVRKKGMRLTIQVDDRNENSDDDDNADEKANGEEKALIPKELNCQEAPRSN